MLIILGWICGQPRIGNKMFMMAPAIAAAATQNATFVLVTGECEWIGWLRDVFIAFTTTGQSGVCLNVRHMP